LRGDTTTSRCNEKMSGRRNKRTRRGDVATSWPNKRKRGWRNKVTVAMTTTTTMTTADGMVWGRRQAAEAAEVGI
jgi:hypothetical protein